MHHLPITLASLALVACAGAPKVESPGRSSAAAREADSPASAAPAAAPAAGEPGQPNEFVLRNSDATSGAPGNKGSKIKSTATEAALKFTVVDKDKGPVKGIVISLTAPDGNKIYTEETDADGYTEVLVPVGQKYDLVFLSLGRREIAAKVNVENLPKQNIKLTLRYKREVFEKVEGAAAPAEPRFVLDGVHFDTGKATIRPESFPRLDSVVEFMTYKKSARIQISGHTDNLGNPKTNKTLSEKRAQACRNYLISKGIDGSRIEAIGHGDERPVAANDSEEGRQKNRRIEAVEL